MSKFDFHPEALFEYSEAADFYLYEASAKVAESFVTVIEAAVGEIVRTPARFRVVAEPEIRRFVVRRFP